MASCGSNMYLQATSLMSYAILCEMCIRRTDRPIDLIQRSEQIALRGGEYDTLRILSSNSVKYRCSGMGAK